MQDARRQFRAGGLALCVVFAAFVLGSLTAARGELILTDLQPVIVAGISPDSPENRVDPNESNSPFAGVGAIIAGGRMGTATALDRYHLLTAAHVVTNASGVIDVTPAQSAFYVNLGDGTYVYGVSAITVHPDYTGFNNPSINDDLAIITLSAPLPVTVPTYHLFTDPIAPGTVFTMVGYGGSGNGVDGQTVGADPFVKRVGQNAVDIGDVDDEGSDAIEIFAFDFDGPTLDTNQVGAGTLGNTLETTLLPGDSGGPSFMEINGAYQLAGVNTFIGSFIGGPEAPLFGSAGGGMLVYSYLDWINNITGIPEPTSGVLVLVIGGGAIIARRRQRAAERSRAL